MNTIATVNVYIAGSPNNDFEYSKWQETAAQIKSYRGYPIHCANLPQSPLRSKEWGTSLIMNSQAMYLMNGYEDDSRIINFQIPLAERLNLPIFTDMGKLRKYIKLKRIFNKLDHLELEYGNAAYTRLLDRADPYISDIRCLIPIELRVLIGHHLKYDYETISLAAQTSLHTVQTTINKYYEWTKQRYQEWSNHVKQEILTDKTIMRTKRAKVKYIEFLKLITKVTD